MSEVAEKTSASVTRIRIGVATHITPKFSLVGNDALQDLILVIDKCVEAGEFKIIIDFASVQTIDSLVFVRTDGPAGPPDEKRRLDQDFRAQQHHRRDLPPSRVSRITFRSSTATVRKQRRKSDDDQFRPWLAARRYPGCTQADQPRKKSSEALKLQDRLGKRLGRILIDKGWVAENDVLRALSEQLGVPFVRLRPGMFDPVIVSALDTERRAAPLRHAVVSRTQYPLPRNGETAGHAGFR